MEKNSFLNMLNIFQSDHPFMLLVNRFLKVISDIWNYQIFLTADKQVIQVSNVVLGIILFIIGLKLAKHLSRKIKAKLNKRFDKNTANLLARILHYLLLASMTIFILDIVNVPLTAFAVVATTFALGIGLGCQHHANNFMSGFIIMMDHPIRVGDIIEVKNNVGRVTNIGARCVCIRTAKNINILIPNSSILQDTVINWTLEDSKIKTGLSFTIASESNIEEFKNIIKETLKECKDVMDTPVPQILLKGICKDGYKIKLEFWINIEIKDNFNKSAYVINELNNKLFTKFEEQGISVIEVQEC